MLNISSNGELQLLWILISKQSFWLFYIWHLAKICDPSVLVVNGLTDVKWLKLAICS